MKAVFSVGPLTARRTSSVSKKGNEAGGGPGEQVLWGAAEGAGGVLPGDAQGRPCCLCNDLKGGCSEVQFEILSQAPSDEMRGNGLKVCQGRLRLGISRATCCWRLGLYSLEAAAMFVPCSYTIGACK